MANGTRQQAQSNFLVVVGLIIAAPALLAPLYVGLLESSNEKTAREIDPDIERVRRRLTQVDEQLNYAREIRQQLTADGVALTADGTSTAANSKGGSKALEDLEIDLREGKKVHTDKTLESIDRAAINAGLKLPPTPRGLGKFKGAASFPELQAKIAANDKLIKDADSEIKAVLSKAGTITSKAGEDVWAQRAAALVGWMKARQALDKAWLDRWQAGELRNRARDQIIETANLRRMALSATASTLDEAIAGINKDKAATDKSLKAARDKAAELKSRVTDLQSRIESLRKEAAAARASMAKMDVKPFKPSDALQATTEFAAYRKRYEDLSDAARKAESQADTLEFGALKGGKMSEGADGDLLTAKYEGGQSEPGVVALEAQLAGREKVIAELTAHLQEQDDAIKTLTDRGTARDAAKQAFSKKADDGALEVDKTLKDIAKHMASAAASEDAARKALLDGEKAAQNAQTSAKARVNKASEYKRDHPSDQPSQRLAAIINDKDTESAALVLGANLAWMRAELLAQAVTDAESQQRLLEIQSKLLGIETKEDFATRIATWRDDAGKAIQSALDRLRAAKAAMATASYDDVDGQRVSGAALKWQISQLEGAAYLLKSLLADSKEASDDARGRARESFLEAVANRENSPYLQTADSILKLLQEDHPSGGGAKNNTPKTDSALTQKN